MIAAARQGMHDTAYALPEHLTGSVKNPRPETVQIVLSETRLTII